MKKFLLTFAAILLGVAVAHPALGPGSKTNRIYGTYVSDVNANWIEIAADASKNMMRVSSGGSGAAAQRPLVFSAQRTNPGTVLVIATNHNVGINTLTPAWDLTVNGVIWGNSVLSYGSTSTVFFSSIVDTRDLQITSKEEGVGKVWTCTNDITGEGKWQTPSGGGGGTADTNNLIVTTTNAALVPLTVVPDPAQSAALFLVLSTNSGVAFAVSNSGIYVGGLDGGHIDLFGTNTENYTRIQVPDDQDADYVLTTPSKSGTIALTSDVGSGGGSNVQTLTVTNTFKMGVYSASITSTNAIMLDLASYNVFKLFLETNCHILFSNAYDGLVNGLVYFRQDDIGNRALLSYSVAGGIIQTQTGVNMLLTTNAEGLDLLEVKSGYYSTNLLCYWPKDFQPRVVTAGMDYGDVQISNITYTVGEGDGTIDIYIQRTNGTDGAAAVEVVTLDGSAVHTNDYMPITNLLEWGDGNDDLKSVEITINDDGDVEGEENFTVFLRNKTNLIWGTPTNVLVSITDDDGASYFFEENFESDSVGGWTISQAITNATDRAGQGTQSARAGCTNTTGGYLQKSIGGQATNFHLYFMLNSLSVTQSFAFLRQSTSTKLIMLYSSDGRPGISFGGSSAYTVSAAPANTWLDFWVHYQTNGLCELWWTTNGESKPSTSSGNYTNFLYPTNFYIDTIRLDADNGLPDSPLTNWWDRILMSHDIIGSSP